jgi:hypothetical protein
MEESAGLAAPARVATDRLSWIKRVGKHALIAHQRYAHAKQLKRANRALKTIRPYLGRVIRDICARPAATRPCSR